MPNPSPSPSPLSGPNPQTESDAGNYGTATTSAIEYWFVVEPEAGLKRLRLDTWPADEKLRATHPERCRQPVAPSLLGAEMQRLNAKLAEMESELLINEELIAARL